MPGLETWSWIAAIVAVPVAIIGWFVSGKPNRATAGAAGTAIAGNVKARNAGVVTGHNSAVNLNLTVIKDGKMLSAMRRAMRSSRRWARRSEKSRPRR